jgi:ligand-binding sensor domain-containing protein
MKNNLLKISIAVFLLIPVKLFAQFTVYTTLNSGLVNNSIGELYTYNDTLWISTLGGLGEFDGKNWTSYTTLNSGLPESTVGPVMKYGKNLWVTTLGGGVSSFNGTTWTNYSPENQTFASYDPEGLTKDSIGDIWFTSRDEGITLYNGNSWTDYNTNNGNPDDVCYLALTDKNGHLWYGTHDVGLVEYNGSTWTKYGPSNSNQPDNQIYALAYDRTAGNLWLGTGSSGLVKFDGATFTTYDVLNSGLTGNYIRNITVAPNSDVWIATAWNGLDKFDGTNWTISNTLNSNLPNDTVWGVAVDNSGNVWAGTEGGGLAELPDYYEGINVIANDIHSLTIFPNPTDGESIVQFQSDYSGEMQIKVLNVLGQEVLIQNTPVITGSNNTTINIPKDYPLGVYIIQFSLNGQNLMKKIVKD